MCKISWLWPLEGPRTKGTTVPMSIRSTQILVPNTILHCKEPGHSEEMVDFRAQAQKIQD